MIKNIKEFEPDYTYDLEDLSSLGYGSGVHNEKQISVTFNLFDRKGDILNNKQSVQSSRYCEGIVFDITDENGKVLRENYQSGLDNRLIITAEENEAIFGDYKKDFGVLAKVIDPTSIYTASGFVSLYGNVLEIEKVTVTDSVGLRTEDSPLGIYLDATLSPSGYRYSGRMYSVDEYDRENSKKYATSGIVIHEGSGYDWEAYLSWDLNSGDLTYLSGYDNFSSEIQDYDNVNGVWSLTVMDYSPNGSFLISSGSKDFHNPYGDYIDGTESGAIKDIITPPYINESGNPGVAPYYSGGLPENKVDVKVGMYNSMEYTKYSHLDVYVNYGDDLSLNNFDFVARFDDISKIYKFDYNEELGLIFNEKFWLKFQPYSALGKGQSWISGPFISKKEEDPLESNFSSSELSITDSDETAHVTYKQRKINSVEYSGSGILDRLFVNQNRPEDKTPIYDYSTGRVADYYTITETSGKWSNTTFDYLFEFSSSENPYSVESRKIVLSATGSSQESGNFGMPLFRLSSENESGNLVKFDKVYSESGVSLLCNISDNPYDTYKFYKTSI